MNLEEDVLETMQTQMMTVMVSWIQPMLFPLIRASLWIRILMGSGITQTQMMTTITRLTLSMPFL